jgi:uncharacterized membrane protein
MLYKSYQISEVYHYVFGYSVQLNMFKVLGLQTSMAVSNGATVIPIDVFCSFTAQQPKIIMKYSKYFHIALETVAPPNES